MGCGQGKARESQEVLAETETIKGEGVRAPGGEGAPGDTPRLQAQGPDPSGRSQQLPLGVALLGQEAGPDTKRQSTTAD